ncbi:MAG: SLC13/DASS family transporter [Ruminococcaceae bacterium]|nr:SLC13/DASS family transporter [Oscillospiraceae bacterium]
MKLISNKTFRQAIIAAAVFIAAILVLVTDSFGAYTEGAKVTPECIYAVIMFCLVFYCFATQLLPIGVTAMLGAFAMVIAGLVSYGEILSNFASQTIMLIVGMSIVGAAFREVGLAQDLGRFIIKHFSGHTKLFLIMLILSTCLISAFMSNTAAVVIFMAVASSASAASGGTIKRKNMFMAIGIASVVGGNLTLFASTPQMSVNGILEITDGVRMLSNWDMFKVGFPLVILLVLFYVLVGEELQNKCFDFEETAESAPAKTESTAPKYKKFLTLGVFGLCIVLFLVGEMSFGTFTLGMKSGTVAVLGGCLCIAFRCIPEKKALVSVDWTTIVMLGGILGFSTAMKASGATDFISAFFTDGYLSYFILVITAVIMTNIMSNTAVAVMLVPIGISIAMSTGVDPICYVMGILFAANTSYATPVATVPITMVRSVGYRFMDYMKVGGAFTVVSLIYTLIAIPLFYGML